MKVVYLDQNKWIELSRESYGRDPSIVLRMTRQDKLRILAAMSFDRAP